MTTLVALLGLNLIVNISLGTLLIIKFWGKDEE